MGTPLHEMMDLRVERSLAAIVGSSLLLTASYRALNDIDTMVAASRHVARRTRQILDDMPADGRER
jgi:hypothetical protein